MLAVHPCRSAVADHASGHVGEDVTRRLLPWNSSLTERHSGVHFTLQPYLHIVYLRELAFYPYLSALDWPILSLQVIIRRFLPFRILVEVIMTCSMLRAVVSEVCYHRLPFCIMRFASYK